MKSDAADCKRFKDTLAGLGQQWEGFGICQNFSANSKIFLSRVFLLLNGKWLEGEKQLMLLLLDIFYLFLQGALNAFIHDLKSSA